MIDFASFGTNISDTVTRTVKQFDVSKLDVTKIDLTKLDLRSVELPKFDMPKFDLPDVPSFDFPKFDLPEMDVPAEVERIADFVRDVTYAGIGAGVIAAQKVDAEVRKLVGKAA